MNYPVRLEVSPAVSTPTGVFNQRFEALFPHAGALSCAVWLPRPIVPPGLSALECGTGHSASHCLNNLVLQPPPCCQPSLPGCPSPPLLPVWMNVFFNSFVVRVPCSLICRQFWLLFVFKLVVILPLVVLGSKAFLPASPSLLELLNYLYLPPDLPQLPSVNQSKILPLPSDNLLKPN